MILKVKERLIYHTGGNQKSQMLNHAIVGAKHYLDFEIKEPQIDAMVDVAQEEDVIDENALGMTDQDYLLTNIEISIML